MLSINSIPNYPEGKYYEGYGIFKRRIDRLNGVKFTELTLSRGKVKDSGLH